MSIPLSSGFSQHYEADYVDLFSALDEMGAQSHFLKNLVEYTEPIAPKEVPSFPQYESKIIGNFVFH